MTKQGREICEYMDLEVKTGNWEDKWFAMPGMKQGFYLADLGGDQIDHSWVSLGGIAYCSPKSDSK
jgi:hypothetical protein